ncbi:hypothetical protein QQ045_007215 [Rhodiola kirilowii]
MYSVFNTDNNHSVSQTHNTTVYALCDADDAALNDTYEWSSADPSATTHHPVTFPVPLITEGPIFFFLRRLRCSDFDHLPNDKDDNDKDDGDGDNDSEKHSSVVQMKLQNCTNEAFVRK